MPSSDKINHEYFMNEALKEAKKAYKLNETPIGAVIVYENKIIARGYNKRETLKDSTAHAELIAIKKACRKLESWRLENCLMYVTLEPCAMCAGGIIQSRIQEVIYGASNERFGAHQGAVKLFDIPFNHQVKITKGIMESKCSKLLSDFFADLRRTKVNK